MTGFEDKLDKDMKTNISDLMKSVGKHDEFEIMFFNYNNDPSNILTYEKFLFVLEYLSYKSRNDKSVKIKKTVSLDIIFNVTRKDIALEKLSKKDKEETQKITKFDIYRISLNGTANVNKYIKLLHKRKKHVIFSVLLQRALDGEEGISLMKKSKDHDKIIDVDDYNFRVRVSSETYPTKEEIAELKNMNETDRFYISFRQKQRFSLELYNKSSNVVGIDATLVKYANKLEEIEHQVPNYELELEWTTSNGKKDDKVTNIIYDNIERLLKTVQQTSHIISNSTAKTVLNDYNRILQIDDADKKIKLLGRQAHSLELHHALEIIPGKYAVTDKADGERYFLIITNGKVYLISNNLHVKNTGITVKDKKWNETIMDGEYIFIPKMNDYIYMVFDCIIAGGKDMRQVVSFMERLNAADEIIKNCFVSGKQKGYQIKKWSGKFDANKISKFYHEEMANNMKALNNDMKIEKDKLLVRRKFFAPVFGGQDNEIYKYSAELWTAYMFDDEIKCPYTLDGMVYHPLEQKYEVRTTESKLHEYKWKPEDKNTIDFYVKFERSRETGKELVLYDNSDENTKKWTQYKIAHLYVGKKERNEVRPVLFQPDSENHVAYLFLKNGAVRDEEGKTIQDKTVVEFYYNNDPNTNAKYRWTPVRTRYDKTESVRRHRQQYGNYYKTADLVWNSIINPLTFDDFVALSKDKGYEKHASLLKSRINYKEIAKTMRDTGYYQRATKLGKPWRNFNNWVKDILIFGYCNPSYHGSKKNSILDIACGRGGDIQKFYFAEADFYVGVDVDNYNLTTQMNGAIMRYNQFKEQYPAFPKMDFIHADAGALLNYDDQNRALGGMSSDNGKMIKKWFDKKFKFDRVNCQFALHYFLKNETVWNNFCENIKNHLKPGGYALFSTWDGVRIAELLGDKDRFTTYFTNKEGQKKKFIEIVKEYGDVNTNKVIGLGNSIKVHNTTFMLENTYFTEFLVDKRFVIKEFDEKCDLELVDTGLFVDIYHNNKQFFQVSSKFDSDNRDRKFYSNIAAYYDMTNDINKVCFEDTKLNRYYIFRRRTSKKITKQKGGMKPLRASGFDKKKYSYSTSEYTDNCSFRESIGEALNCNSNLDILPKDNRLTTKRVKSAISKFSDANEELGLKGFNVVVIDEDDEVTTYSRKKEITNNDPTVYLYSDEDGYHPIYVKTDSKKMLSIHPTSKKLIKKLVG